jgi:predicted adenine nucleotide alpha hydrolase (AANH) superfamily ATPase
MFYNTRMKVLLHICCAPCAIYPLETLRSSGVAVDGYFFNHNIHPYQEYRRRLDTVRQYAALVHLELICHDEYRLEEFLAATSSRPEERCRYCYVSRLDRAAQAAAEFGYDVFTSTLLYSRYQQHDLIRREGEQAAARHGVSFLYEDFRRGWQQGIAASKEMGLYRQQYCGCIYSEKDRYLPKAARSRKETQ